MDSSAKIQLRVPAQDLQRLTFNGASPKKLAEWIEALPKVNVGETSRQLYSVVQEINRFQTDAKNRFLLLEELRSSIHYVCKALGKHFLNQSIILPEKESKIANLAQALQNHLAVGYKVVIIESLSLKSSEANKLRIQATHRALCELSGNLLRCFQLYYPTPKDLWRELHQLHMLASHYNILDELVDDAQNNQTLTIEQCYIRTMLLGTARPNQLRQREIDNIYRIFSDWSPYCQLRSMEGTPEPFIVNLISDEGPTYSQWADKKGEDSNKEHYRYVQVNDLAIRLTKSLKASQQAETGEEELLNIRGLSETVLRHLIQSWSASTQRSFARTLTKGDIGLAFGLGAIHHYISGGRDFNQMLLGGDDNIVIEDEDNPFLRGNQGTGFRDELRSGADVWDLQSVTVGNLGGGKIASVMDGLSTTAGATHTGGHKVQTLFPSYQCQLIDTSPGGYCIQWDGAAPQQLKTGELVTLKEAAQSIWSIAVIRWIKKMSNKSARLGLELLAPHAEACGAKVIQKTGGSTEYMRCIRLPELKAIAQPSTLITPHLTFRAGYKVLVNISGQEVRTQLLKEITSTASFSQFEYKIIGGRKNEAVKPDDSEAGDEFSSLWTSI